MDVRYSWWGREEYRLDGRLLHKRWNLTFRGIREFVVESHVVRIEVSIGTENYDTRVYVDGKLHVEQLFPEIARSMKKRRSSKSHPVLRGRLFGL